MKVSLISRTELIFISAICYLAFFNLQGGYGHFVNLLVVILLLLYSRIRINKYMLIFVMIIPIYFMLPLSNNLDVIAKSGSISIFLCVFILVGSAEFGRKFGRIRSLLPMLMVLLLIAVAISVIFAPVQERDTLWFPWGHTNRASLNGLNSNATAFILLIVLLAVQQRNKFLTFMLQLITVCVTASRGALVGWAVTLGKSYLFILLTFIIIAVSTLAAFSDRLRHISGNPRLIYWENTLIDWSHGSAYQLFFGHRASIIIDSTYLNILYSYGIIGVVILIFSLVSVYRKFLRVSHAFAASVLLISCAMIFYEFWGQTKILIALMTLKVFFWSSHETKAS